MLVTTVYDPSAQTVEHSKLLAAELQSRWVARRSNSLPRLRSMYNDQQILLLTSQGLQFYNDSDVPLFFHPSTSAVRLKRLIQGEPDLLLRLAGAAPGSSVLDCTAGLASDAIIFAHAVGSAGQVTALESEPIIYLLLREGLKSYVSAIPELNEAKGRILLVNQDHMQYLLEQPNNSIDIVYFDPMFRKTIEESSSISPLRDVANPRPLQRQAITEAIRVARKTVIMKEHKDSGEFTRLGFTKLTRTHSKIAYGVIEC